MNPVGRFTKLMAYSVAVAAMFTVSSVEAAVGKAVVRTIRGTASYAETGGEYKALKVGKVLGPGSTIRTSAESTVDLFLGDNGPTVRVIADTTVSFDKLNVDDAGSEKVIETLIDLKAGTIQGYVKKMAQASKYEVKTPNGVAGIRGTIYQISANGKVQVQEGTVLVAYQVGNAVQTYTVNAGQTLTPPTTPGGAPTVGPTPPGTPVIVIPKDPQPPKEGGPTVVVTPEPVVVISPTNPAAPATEQQQQQ